MKLFLLKLIKFAIIFPIVFIIAYFVSTLFIDNMTSDNSIFIWGDSQAYQGIDLEILKQETNAKVYTAAQHGAGAYDFLIFAEKVPANSTVVMALSKPVQLRRKSKDKNRSGISLKALKALMNNGYSLLEVGIILAKNPKPTSIFSETTSMYPYADSIFLAEPISVFEKIHENVPAYLSSKQELLLYGIQQLKDKNCKLSFVEFPYHDILQEIESNSAIRSETEKLKDRVQTHLIK